MTWLISSTTVVFFVIIIIIILFLFFFSKHSGIRVSGNMMTVKIRENGAPKNYCIYPKLITMW